MNYQEWLDAIETLRVSNKDDLIKRIAEEPENPNISNLLAPKLDQLIKDRFQKSINKIIGSLETMFEDENNLDLDLLNFKKEVLKTKELLENKQMTEDHKQILNDMIKRECDNVYNILIKEADRDDDTGVLSMVIKNNRIKWSDNNEL